MSRATAYLLPTMLALTVVVTGCETAPQRPTLYPNNHYKSVGDAQAQADVDACMAEATDFGLQEKQDAKAGQKAAKGATIGAVTAGAWGLVRGDAGERALAGAAAGAAGGATSGAFDAQKTDPTYKNFVQKCLADKGYSIIGWQ